MQMTADFPTARAAALMGTMAKHFGHKLSVTVQDDQARLDFPMGQASLRAADDALHLAVQAQDQAGLDRLRDVIESHLMRFAHRDDPAPLVWSPTA